MKKIISLLLAVLLCFALFACGTQNGGSADADKNTSTSAQTTTEKVDPDAEKVNAVIDSINKIGDVTIQSKAKIDDAKKLYNALTDAQKAKVTNYSTLEAAQTKYDGLAKAEKDKLMNQYKSKFDADHDKVENVTWYQHKNMPEYIDIRSYLIPYIGVQNNNAWICVRYNYTADDWIFWENLTILVDGEKFYIPVGAFNTVRDNDNGVVWEWYDDVYDYNADFETSDVKMLQKIANSKETIVRFQGDEYHYDLTVSSQDKAMIKDVLGLYSAYVKY